MHPLIHNIQYLYKQGYSGLVCYAMCRLTYVHECILLWWDNHMHVYVAAVAWGHWGVVLVLVYILYYNTSGPPL